MLVRTIDNQDHRAHLRKDMNSTQCGKRADSTKSVKDLELCDQCLEAASHEITRIG